MLKALIVHFGIKTMLLPGSGSNRDSRGPIYVLMLGSEAAPLSPNEKLKTSTAQQDFLGGTDGKELLVVFEKRYSHMLICHTLFHIQQR